MSFKIGFNLKICKDSKILRSKPVADQIILKLSKDILPEQLSAWLRIEEWGRVVNGIPVQKDLPKCSHILTFRVQVVEPTYSDEHCSQLNLSKDISPEQLSAWLRIEELAVVNGIPVRKGLSKRLTRPNI